MRYAFCVIPAFAVIVFTSCQRRSLCTVPTVNGGTTYVRIYRNNYNSSQEYNDAITQYKNMGYSCDDSVSVD